MGVFTALVRAARPRHWIKNFVCLAGIVFAGRLGDPAAHGAVLRLFAAICLASSALYVLNDVVDRDADRLHPVKRLRPIASGRLTVPTALLWSFALAMVATWLIAGANVRTQVLFALFIALNLAYSLGVKSIAVVDVISIAVGFALRVQIGIDVISAPRSPWILLCMFFTALFLGFGKRRGEVMLLGADAARHRAVLADYSLPFLDVLLAMSATTALVCYSLYAVTVHTSTEFLATILPVTYGIARYAGLVARGAHGGDPGEILSRDPPLLLAVAVWAGLCVALLYARV